jgi:hypothetical protein
VDGGSGAGHDFRSCWIAEVLEGGSVEVMDGDSIALNGGDAFQLRELRAVTRLPIPIDPHRCPARSGPRANPLHAWRSGAPSLLRINDGCGWVAYYLKMHIGRASDLMAKISWILRPALFSCITSVDTP